MCVRSALIKEGWGGFNCTGYGHLRSLNHKGLCFATCNPARMLSLCLSEEHFV